jgi:hypothetical protein
MSRSTRRVRLLTLSGRPNPKGLVRHSDAKRPPDPNHRESKRCMPRDRFGFGVWKKKVDMVQHEDERKEFPAVPNHGVFQAIEQLLAINVIPEDRLSRVATRHHVVDCANVLDSQWSGHGGVQERTSGVVWRAGIRVCDTPASQRTPASLLVR